MEEKIAVPAVIAVPGARAADAGATYLAEAGAKASEAAAAVAEATRWIDVGEVADDSAEREIKRILAHVREHLEMDAALISEFAHGKQVFRFIEGDAESFGVRAGDGVPLEETYCQRVVDGRLSNAVADAKQDERVKDLRGTHEADIGSYVGVPLILSDGTVYGSLCVLSHDPDVSFGARDVKTAHLVGRLIADQLERHNAEFDYRRSQLQHVGVRSLLAALEAKDGYTGQHSEAVVALSVAVGRQLGLPEKNLTELEQVALLHDIGKIGIPDSVLKKKGPLRGRERDVMQQHTVIGARIIASIDSLRHLEGSVRAEHERWDGEGYPDGLSGDDIPLASRITFACDAYHAMVSDRPYRRAMRLEAALEELRLNAGTQFSPDVVDVLLEVVRRGGR